MVIFLKGVIFMKNTNFLTQNLSICGGLVLALLLGNPINTMSNFDFIFPKSVYAQEATSDYPYYGMTAQQIYDKTKAEWESELDKVITYYQNHPRDVLEIKPYYKPEDLNLDFFQSYLKYRTPSIDFDDISDAYNGLYTDLPHFLSFSYYNPTKVLDNYSCIGVGGLFGPTSPDIYRAQKKYISHNINSAMVDEYIGNFTDDDIKTFHNKILNRLSNKETYYFKSNKPNGNLAIVINGYIQNVTDFIQKDGILYTGQYIVESDSPDYIIHGANGYIYINGHEYKSQSEISLTYDEGSSKNSFLDIKELCALLKLGYAYDDTNKIIHISSKGLAIPEQRSKEVYLNDSNRDDYKQIVEPTNPSQKVNWGTYDQIKSLPLDTQKFFAVGATGTYIKSNLLVGLWQNYGSWSNCFQNFVQHPTMIGYGYNPVATMYLWNEVNNIRQQKGLEPYKWAYDLLPITIGNGIAQAKNGTMTHIVGLDALGSDSRNDWIKDPEGSAKRIVQLWLGSSAHASILLDKNVEYACCSAGANGIDVFQIWDGYYSSNYKEVTLNDLEWLNGTNAPTNVFDLYVVPNMMK